MHHELTAILNQYIEIMKKTDGVIGAWHFGSVMHQVSDEYSDVDVVLLITPTAFHSLENMLVSTLAQVCDELLLCWEESFNGDAIINNGYLLKKNGKIFQFDLFLLNHARLDDFMCKLHYTGLTERDIIFDSDGSVKQLCKIAPVGSLWQDDIERLIKTYYYHFHMSAKYILRRDYFKLNHVMRTLYDTHVSLLLTAHDKIRWGGEKNKLHFIPADMQEHVKHYYCTDDFKQNRANLRMAAEWFADDFKAISNKCGISYEARTVNEIMEYWTKCTEEF